jgi:hypothetical protein
MYKPWFLLVFFIIIYGCSNHQSNQRFSSLSQSGSYKEKNKYVVEFRGSGVTSYQKAKEYALHRAAKTTLAQGYRYFKVVKTRNISFAKTVKNISKDGIENFALFSATKEKDVVIERSPGVRLTIECYKNDPKIFSIIDAQEYIKKNLINK